MFGRIIGITTQSTNTYGNNTYRPQQHVTFGDPQSSGVQIDVLDDEEPTNADRILQRVTERNTLLNTQISASAAPPTDRFISNFVPKITGPTVVTQLGGHQVKLLTDDDVLAEIRDYMSNMKTSQLTPILRGFQNAVSSLIAFAAEIVGDDEENSANLDRTRRIIGFCPPEELFIRAKDKVWAVRDHILTKDLKYFLERDYSNMIKRDKKQELLEDIIGTVKDFAALMSNEQHEALWTKVKIILHWVATYLKLRQEIQLQQNVPNATSETRG